jgi:hypothetical protein
MEPEQSMTLADSSSEPMSPSADFVVDLNSSRLFITGN